MSLTISCDDCSRQCTAACDDCVVTFLLRGDGAVAPEAAPVMLDADEERVVQLLARVGLVPELRYRVAS